MKLIDKDALEAEIEQLDALYHVSKNLSGDLFIQGLFCFLDTSKVKEVDLEAELNKWRHNHFHGRRDKEASGEYLERISQLELAKHFFELGLSVNNPITASDKGMAEEIIINLKRVEQDYCINLTKEMEWLRNKVQKGEKV